MNINSLKEYLEHIAKFTDGKSVEVVVLKHGQQFSIPEVVRPKWMKRGKKRQCYANSYRISTTTSWKYVEGFSVNKHGIPIQHAWVVNNENVIAETTLEKLEDEYYGIIIDENYIHKAMIESGVFGVQDMSNKVFREKYLKHLK